MDKLTIFVYKKLFADEELKEKMKISKRLKRSAEVQVVEGHYRDAYQLFFRANLILVKVIEDFEGRVPHALISKLKTKSSDLSKEAENVKGLAKKEALEKLDEIEKGLSIRKLSDIVTATDEILLLGEKQKRSSNDAKDAINAKVENKMRKLTAEQAEMLKNLQRHSRKKETVKWNDIIGHEKAKSFLMKVAEYPALRDRCNRFANDPTISKPTLGLYNRALNGCLLYGPTGCGKNRFEIYFSRFLNSNTAREHHILDCTIKYVLYIFWYAPVW